MPSQISTSAATTAAEEKLKIHGALGDLAAARPAAPPRSVSSASSSRNGSLGSAFDALGEGEQALFELRIAALSASPRGVAAVEADYGYDERRRRCANASPRNRNTRAPITLPLEKANWLATSTATTVSASACRAVTADAARQRDADAAAARWRPDTRTSDPKVSYAASLSTERC